jgi:hypothetical protein
MSCLFTLLIVSLAVQKLLTLMQPCLFIFAFVAYILGHIQESLSKPIELFPYVLQV